MQVYSASSSPGTPVLVRHRGMKWQGVRDANGAVEITDTLIPILHSAGWTVGRLQSEVDLTSLGADEPFDLSFRVRRINEPVSGENRAEKISKFLPHFAGKETLVVEWTDAYAAVVLDIDVHGDDLPPLPLGQAAMLTPTPYAVKQSRHGGLHCLYLGCGVHTATGLASLAAFDVARVFPGVTGVEVLTRCRCSPAGWVPQTTPRYKPFSANLYTIDADEVQEWVTERGLHIGGRYGHSLCPFNPDGEDAVDANPSVSVTQDGVKCFRCNKFSPWSRLLYDDTGELPPIWRMAKARVWWDQVEGWAKFHHPDMCGYLKDAYREAIILMNGVDRGALRALMEHAILRTDMGWYAQVGDHISPLEVRQIRRALNQLPSLYRLPRAGEEDCKSSQLLIGNLDNIYSSMDLPLPDVPPLHLARPSFCASPETMYEDGWTWYLKRPQWSRTDSPPPAEDVEWAWETIEEYFPGVNREYLSLLITAHLVCRHELQAQPLIIAVTGVSGGGKTNTVRLAAALTSGTAVIANADASDFNLQLGSALLAKPDLIVVDEYLKRDTEASALAIYELGQYYTVTVKYANPVTVPVHCPIVLTGIALAQIFRRSAQFLRRVVKVDLHRACHWPKAKAENLLEHWNRTPIRRRASDILCSHLAYKYVLGADNLLTGWETAVADFAPEEDDEGDYVEVDDQIRDLLIALEQHGVKSNLKGRIRYFLNLRVENPAVRAWLDLCDGPSGNALYSSARVQERDLMNCLNLTQPTRILASRQRADTLSLALKQKRRYLDLADLKLETANAD